MNNLMFVPFQKGKYVCSKCGGINIIPSCDFHYNKKGKAKYVEFAKCVDCNNIDNIPMTKEEFKNKTRTELIDKIL